LKEEKILWKRKKSAVLEKNEDQEKTAENLMTQITKDLKEEVARIEEPAKTEENLRNSIIVMLSYHGELY
jgi:hypothetical protein